MPKSAEPDVIETPANSLESFHQDESGGTTLEWTLLLVAIVLPGYYLIRTGIAMLVGYYQMMAFLNSLPFP